MNRIFVPDGNWYIHRAYNTVETSRPLEDVLPGRVLSMICKDALAVRATHLLFAVDGPEVFRYDLYPDYKANRDGKKEKKGKGKGADSAEAEDDPVYKCLPNMFDLLDHCGISFYQPRKYEADDVLCSIAHRYGGQCIVIGGTQDKDSYQWFTEHTWAYNSAAKGKDGKSKPKHMKVEDAEKKFGVKISQMVDYQCIIGDKIDNVIGLPGYGPAKAASKLKEYGSIRRWFENGSQDDRVFLRKHQEKLRLNRQMVELKKDVLPPGDLSDLKMAKRKVTRDVSQRYHDYANFVYPRTKGLFS